MKKILMFLYILILVLGFSLQTHADLNLIGQGTSAHGTYNLIYDTHLDITWYDFSAGNDLFSWSDSVNWADGLSVDFGGTIFDDWRLPSTVDGPYVWGTDGTTTVGYNITSSEMGHLFYTELGNEGLYDTSGNITGCGDTAHGQPSCLSNKGDFQNLRTNGYWSGTEYSTVPADAWRFLPDSGYQGNRNKGGGYYAIAVMDGMAVVPEPISAILFVTGGTLLAGRRYMKRKKKA